jgi:hypothetical protein
VFYGVPTGYSLQDPRVLYDQSSGRFIASAVAIASNWSSNLYLAMSQSSDPTGLWAVQSLGGTNRALIERPTLGTSDDKVTVAWSMWLQPGCDPSGNACLIGEFFSVLDKVDVMGGAGFQYTAGPDLNRYAIVPVQALSSTTTQYLAYNNADPFFLVESACPKVVPPPQYGACPTIGIMSITGSVRAQTVAVSEVDLPINSTTHPPRAPQQSVAGTLDTGDDRLLSAVWQNNQLWVSATDGNHCPTTDPAGAPPHSCALVVEVRTDTNPMTVMEKTIDSGDFIYYPAISLDNAGDVFAVFSRSSSTMYPSAWITGLPAATPNTWSPLALLTAGAGPYASTACGATNRWGDYSGASVDGSDPTDVWVAGEYAGAANTCTWKTALGRLTYSAPTVTSITPAVGPASGGTAVTITGTNFVTGTTPYFGSTPSPTGTTTVQSANTLTTTTPPGSGWVTVSAATADGHGPPGPVFKYPRLDAAPGTFTALPGGTARSGAPPHVLGSPTGPRPAVQVPPQNLLPSQNLPPPLAGEGRGGGVTQPVRLLRLLLL